MGVQQEAPDGPCPPPFSIRPLRCEGNTTEAPPSDELLSLLPASYRTGSDDIAVARDVFVTGQLDMHLVWTTDRIFLKPIPRFLLEPSSRTRHISCAHSCRCPARGQRPGTSPDGAAKPTRCGQTLWRCALGFLFSYAALITHETDFLIAKEKLLLLAEVSWYAWRTLVCQLDTEHIYPRIERRFIYGELRLSRLNKIYFLSQKPMRRYVARWQRYSTFFNFAWLASATVYLAVVLTAMQVGLATDALAGNAAFQSASYGFTLLSILGPLVAAGLIITAFSYLLVTN